MPNRTPASSYRGRIAPSPTGLLHLGHASTFFFAAQRATQERGVLVFRNDDLDRSRCRAEYLALALQDLRWLGLTWQEGPDVGGPDAPYSQSERMNHYEHAFEKLLHSGYLYPCRCSRREVEMALQAPHEGESSDLYPGTCRPHTSTGIFPPRSGINWRFRIPAVETISFEDDAFGTQTAMAGVDFGDFLVWRKDDTPSYQLATVVDDHCMRITEVVRGADLIPSTFQQMFLYTALGLVAPRFFHCPLLKDSSGKRLAKRHDSLSLHNLREKGYRPEAILSAIERQSFIELLAHS